jgi:hypothetical protein
MVNLAVRLSIRRCPSKFMNVTSWEHRTFNNKIIGCGKFTILTLLSLLILYKLSFPRVCLKISSLPLLTLKSLNKIFIWYLRSLSNTCSSFLYRTCPSYHQFYLLLGNEQSEKWYHTSDLLVLCTTSYN